MRSFTVSSAKYLIGAGLTGSLLLTQGCIATRDWVRENVQDPLTGRISQSEGRLEKAEGQINGLGTRVSGVEGKLGQFEGRLGEIDSKAERALTAIGNLRLERKLVIDMKDGANFAFNSTALPPQAQREIDSFLSDFKGDAAGADGVLFMVAGHTDNVGKEEYNYDLGKRRADAVSRYLITKKNLDPLRVVPVSYGQSAPMEENNTPQGRAKNRRVEILVYRDGVTSTAATPAAQPQSPAPAPSASQQNGTSDNRISQR